MNPDSSETPERFKQLVLEWLRARRPEADTIVSVDGVGSDWAGSTEGGFYSTFSVDIYWTGSGKRGCEDVEGDDMASLWAHVVKSVGTEETR